MEEINVCGDNETLIGELGTDFSVRVFLIERGRIFLHSYVLMDLFLGF